jgi:hypothetical protein
MTPIDNDKFAGKNDAIVTSAQLERTSSDIIFIERDGASARCGCFALECPCLINEHCNLIETTMRKIIQNWSDYSEGHVIWAPAGH